MANWHQLMHVLSTHEIRQDKDGRLWAPVAVSTTEHRKAETVVSLSAMVLDFDSGILPMVAVGRIKALGLAGVIHSTHSHNAYEPKFRIIVPFAAPVAAGDWPLVWQELHQQLGPESDASCKNANRIYYLPSVPENLSFDSFGDAWHGEAYDVAPLLERIRAAEAERQAKPAPPRPRAERPQGSGDYRTVDLLGWAQANGAKPRQEKSGEGKIFIECPWRAEHTDGRQDPQDSYLLDKGDGWPVYKCSHSHCQGRGFKALSQAWPNVDAHCQSSFVPSRGPSYSPPDAPDLPEPPTTYQASDQEIAAGVEKLTRAPIEWAPTTRDGDPKCGVSNAAIFLRHAFASKTVRLNEFTRLIELDGEPVRDPQIAHLFERIELVSGQTKWSRGHLDMALQLIAAASPKYHPVREYLRGLPPWDGAERIPTLIGAAIQVAEPEEIFDRYLECFFVSAVARVMQPGCKVDTALILQGRQGARKSSFFRYLMPDESWFSDDMGSLESKDAQMAIGRSWIVEWAELESLRRSNVNSVKSFLTRQVDQYRPPYGREIIDVPRSAVIVGSTNEGQFLTDPTGNRRYMVIPVERIDTDSVASIRDLLWAEAYAKWKGGLPWYLTGEETTRQSAKNQELVSEDPWMATVLKWLPSGGLLGSEYQVDMERLLGNCLEIPAERRNRIHQMRVAQIMTEIGWERKRLTHKGRRQWVYVAPQDWNGDA